MLRPHNMSWVDLLVDRDAVHEAIHLLAASSIIELRSYDRSDLPFEIKADDRLLERLTDLDGKLDRYRKYLPDGVPGKPKSHAVDTNFDSLAEMETRVSEWLTQVGAPVRELEQTQSSLDEYLVVRQCLHALPAADYDLRYFVKLSRSRLYSAFIALGKITDAAFFRGTEMPVMYHAYPLPGDDARNVFVGVAETQRMPELERAAHSAQVRFLRVPSELEGPAPEAIAQLNLLIDNTAERIAQLRARIDEVSVSLHMPMVVWNLERQLWVSQVLTDSLKGARFVWLGGWVAARRYPELLRILEEGGIAFLVNRDTANQHGPPPALLDNPRWMRKFEVFVRGFGMPAENDIDPTPLLAFSTPLMFGYMFGDVGHGIVLCAIGWLWRRRVPVLALLIPAGLVSMLFGFAFGSIFSYEHLIPALWLHPMSEPLTILGIPLVFGFLLISAGLLLAGVQAHWHAGAGAWWTEHFPVILMYSAGLPLVLWHWQAGLLLVLAGGSWFLAARALPGLRKHSLALVAGALVKGLLQLIELLVQLVINTVSFARLGAFALAHAGLSTAVITLVELVEAWWVKIPLLVLGNLVVIALEGLVVSIQTTRLVMFEFFRRFYAGEGSGFKPLTLPR